MGLLRAAAGPVVRLSMSRGIRAGEYRRHKVSEAKEGETIVVELEVPPAAAGEQVQGE